MDGLGNWKSTTYTPVGSSSTTEIRTHNRLNQVTAFGVPPASTPVLYDHGNNTGTASPSRGNGNIAVPDDTRVFTFDALNRLTAVMRVVPRVTVGVNVGQYAYDALGRRVQKIVSEGGLSGTVPNGTSRYLLDSDQVIEELDGTAGATSVQYVWGQYIDELIQLKALVGVGPQPLAAGPYYLLSDLLYRSVALTNTSGTVAEAYDTDAYGNTLLFMRSSPSSVWFTDDDTSASYSACRLAYAGREFDPESLLYYYRSRYNSPRLGRFISRDQIDYRDGPNLYLYVGGRVSDPLDPFGEAAPTTLSAPEDPEPDFLAVIRCDGNGGFKAFYNEDNTKAAALLKLGCVKSIVEAHEAIHVEDWKQTYPNACREHDAANGRPLDPGQPPNAHARLAQEKFLVESEKRAWGDSLSRMKAYPCVQCALDSNAEPVKLPEESVKCCEWIRSMLPIAEEMARTGQYPQRS